MYRHALVEARHFLGLYRNRVGDKSGMKDCFKANIFAAHLFRGISSFSDVFFFIKLLQAILISCALLHDTSAQLNFTLSD
ncbi:hypothetical protein EWM98_16295 [Escherichia coli]|nr:hypothetical protein [Escherichia coli]EFA5227499.1 hypothetical protein [Escherichia coli]EFN4368131.1 hypothetical protein [Escherichia coli]